MYEASGNALPLALGRATPAPSPLEAGRPAGRLPRAGWPHKNDLDYAKVLIELCLLLLAVPYLITKLARRPKSVIREAGEHHLG